MRPVELVHLLQRRTESRPEPVRQGKRGEHPFGAREMRIGHALDHMVVLRQVEARNAHGGVEPRMGTRHGGGTRIPPAWPMPPPGRLTAVKTPVSRHFPIDDGAAQG